MHLYQSAQVTIHCWPKHGSYPLIVNIYISMYRSDSVGSIFCSWIRLRVRGTISPGVEPILLVSLSLVRIRIGGKVGSWSDNNIKGWIRIRIKKYGSSIIADLPAWTIMFFFCPKLNKLHNNYFVFGLKQAGNYSICPKNLTYCIERQS